MNITDKNSGVLIGGFKAIGKSTLAKKYSNVIDLESSNFEYIIDKELAKIPIEQRTNRIIKCCEKFIKFVMIYMGVSRSGYYKWKNH